MPTIVKTLLRSVVLLFLLPFCFPAFFCSCAMMSDPPSMQHSCRGFDFNKKFPRIRKGEKFLSVEYDTNVKRLTNRDGLHFMKDDFDPPEWDGEDSLTMRRTAEELRVLEWPMYPYNYCDLALSEKEKSYIAAFDARERAFDRQYAGEIKRKLFEASTLRHPTKWKRRVDRLEYPYYLVGKELPPGLVTPASYFTADFMFEYIRDYTFRDGGLWTAPLARFIDETMSALFSDQDFALEIAYDVADGARDRLEALYPEYVLTYYNLKSYSSAEERQRVVRDLAVYYSDVAFRGSAERLFCYHKYLSARQRCRIANYAASRVYDLVMQMESREKLEVFKRKYQHQIMAACEEIIAFPIYRKEKAGLITRAERLAQDRLISKKVISGEVRCAND